MTHAALADAVLLLHALFIAWVVAGGLAVWRWPWLAWAHLPALAWGAWIELSHGVCPLTHLEVHLRRRAGEAGFEGGFIDRYLMPLIYPPGLGAQEQVFLGVGLLAGNAVLYTFVFRHVRHRRGAGSTCRS